MLRLPRRGRIGGIWTFGRSLLNCSSIPKCSQEFFQSPDISFPIIVKSCLICHKLDWVTLLCQHLIASRMLTRILSVTLFIQILIHVSFQINSILVVALVNQAMNSHFLDHFQWVIFFASQILFLTTYRILTASSLSLYSGVFTVAGIVDACIYHSQRAIKKKVDLGKFG